VKGWPIAPLVLSPQNRRSWRGKFVVIVLPDRYLSDAASNDSHENRQA
jgi:hypothetical protein